MWFDSVASRIASFARKILVGGRAAQELAEVFGKHPGVSVAFLESSDTTSNEPYDCIVVDNPAACFPELETSFAALGQRLSSNGYLFLHIPDHVSSAEARGEGNPLQGVLRLLSQAGLGVYLQWRVADEEATGDPSEKTARQDHSASPTDLVHAAQQCSREGRMDARKPCAHVIGAVHSGYNPAAHARDLFRAGWIEGCYEVLALIPDAYLAEPAVAAKVYADMQYCKSVMGQTDPPCDVLTRFFEAQVLFYKAVSRVPGFHEAYHTQAELWRHIGDEDMGLRLLRSVQHVVPNEATQRLIEAWRPAKPVFSEQVEPPPWNAGAFRPNILMLVTPGRPHFGMDVLYDGLCTVLGGDHVVEFPWKKTLHGHAADERSNYPCVFNRPGRPLELDALVTQLREGSFDYVLFCDLEEEAGKDVTRRIMDAAKHLPLFIVDVQDDPVDNRPDVLAYLGLPSACAYFKREMLACHDYGPHTYPLPFAYPDGLAPSDVSGPRPLPVFWAGHRRFGLRRLYLERLEAMLGTAFDREYPCEEYAAALRSARIGINIFGFGYDTVRYWELPAHGCMLLSERLPIRIPYNFRDGESAVFFDDARDLDEKLAYWLSHPQEAEAVAAAGHAHFKRYHTGSARARQLLGWMESTSRM